jgi:predicted dehydrogenase
MSSIDRRDFLKASAATLPALTAAGAADKPNDKIILAVMGVHGRGRDLVREFSSFENVELATICDPDESVAAAALKIVDKRQKRQPKIEKDIRRVLQNKEVTAVAIAAPDHWHALATIWACQAGKHV